MTRPAPSHSIHVGVVRFVSRFIGYAGAGPDGTRAGDIDSSVYWGYMINMGWGLLAFACGVALGVIGLPLQAIFGDGVGDVILCIVVGAAFFCLAGSAVALWCRYVTLPRARRLSHGGPPAAYEYALAHSLPPNASIALQAAVGVVAVVITVVNLWLAGAAQPRPLQNRCSATMVI